MSRAAKITCPVLPDVFMRARLFARLDEFRRRPVVWVSGAAGTGKTTLAVSYVKSRGLECLWYQIDPGDGDPPSFFHHLALCAESAGWIRPKALPRLLLPYQQDPETFSRRFHEALFAVCPRPSVVIFNDYHLLPDDSPVHDLFRVGLEQCVEQVNVLVLSREAAPSQYARLQANRAVAIVGEQELWLTPDEAEGVAALYPEWHERVDEAARLNASVGGWAAGLILLLESAYPATDLSATAREVLFEYFANELFEGAEPRLQAFLLKTALPATISAAEAEAMTGVPNAGPILRDLARRHFFTELREEEPPVFQYHPLFRAFLVARARRELPAPEFTQLLNDAGEALVAHGRAEQAVDLFKEANNRDALARIIRELAPELLAQGRWQVVRSWLNMLPDEAVAADSWLSYWYAASLLPADAEQARVQFEAAYTRFTARGEVANSLLAWCGIVEAVELQWGHFKPLDRWIEQLEDLAPDFAGLPSTELEARVAFSMFAAMMFRRPEHPRIGTWADRALELATRHPTLPRRMQIGAYLIHYRVWLGDIHGAQMVLDKFKESAKDPDSLPLDRLIWKIDEAVLLWHKARFDECLEAVDTGLALGETVGIRLLDYWLIGQAVYACLCRQDLQGAESYLERMKPVLHGTRWLDISHYHYLFALICHEQGHLDHALRNAKIALELAEESGTPFPQGLNCLTIAQLLHEQGDAPGAEEYLSIARRIAAAIRSRYLECIAGLVDAVIAYDRGADDRAAHALREALAIGRANGLVNFAGWRHQIMARLCQKALAAGIETSYVSKLVRERGLVPEPAPTGAHEWPWPLKVRTLGRFAVFRNDEALRFTAKAQRRTLHLLKALIALGGREVPEEALADALWPDSDGDAALRALATTLHRLRRLLGADALVLRSNKQLSLDLRQCWVDAWAFENELDQAGAGSPAGAMARTERAIALYEGEFLVDETQAPWAVAPRERLRARYLHAVLQLGEYWQAQGAPEKCGALYERALSVDDVAESLYQALICHHLRHGRHAQALAAYERCHRTLGAKLGIEPSPQTQALTQQARPDE